MALRLRHLAWLPYWQGTDCALPSLSVIGTTVLGMRLELRYLP